MVDGSVVGGGVALSEEVGLDGCISSSQPLPINLVEIIGFEDEGADDTDTGRGLHDHVDLSEHDVLGAADSRSVGGGLDLELSA